MHFDTIRDKILSTEGITIIFIILLATVLRLHELGNPPFWEDELYGVWAAKNFLEGQGFSAVVGESQHYYRAMITYLLLLTTSMQIFGYNEVAARLPSVIIGVSTVLLVYIISKDIGNKTLALFASILMAMDFWVLTWHTQARMYVHHQFLFLLGVWLISQWYRKDRLKSKSKYLYFFVVAVILGIHNHLSYLVILPILFLFLLLSMIHEIWSKKLLDYETLINDTFISRHVVNLLRLITLGTIYILIEGFEMFVWWLNHTPEWYESNYGLLYYLDFLNAEITFLSLFAIGLMLVWDRKDNWIIPIAFIVPFVFHSVLPFKQHRFIFHIYPLVLILYSIPLVYLVNIIESFFKNHDYLARFNSIEISKVLILGAIIFLFVINSPIDLLDKKDEQSHISLDLPNHRDAVEFILEDKQSEHVIISSSPSITNWYLQDKNRLNYTTNTLLSEEKIHANFKLVENKDEMKKIINEKEGWVIAGPNFYESSRIERDVKKIIIDNSEKIQNQSSGHVDIYRFN